MREPQDFVIRRLLAEQEQRLPPDDFLLKLSRRMDGQKRGRRLYRILAITGCLVLSALSAPWVAQGTSNLIELTAMGLRAMGPLLYHPLTLFIVGATTIGCSPVIYLWRTGRW
jgi:hypothetical protein